MANIVTYNRIRLNWAAPWDLKGETMELYSNFFHLSGASPLTGPAIEQTVLDLATPILQMSRPGAHLDSYRYYAPESHKATDFKQYAATDHPTTGAAYPTGTGSLQQAEVCILCEGPTDINTRGKQVYLRKFIHWVMGDNSTGNDHLPFVAGDFVAKWKTGCGPNLLVPVDPDSGMQASTWTVKNHLYTRQFRKGKKRKVATKIEYIPVPVP